MNRRLGLLIPTAAILAVVGGFAWAQSVADVVERWGLLGTWSVDCLVPSKQFASVSYSRASDGAIVRTAKFGDGEPTTAQVVAARNEPDGSLVLTEKYPNRVMTVAIQKAQNGRIRSMSSRETSGEYLIRDGKFTANNADTPSLSRCR